MDAGRGVTLHEAYISHVMRCSACYAPTSRYCPVGESARADYLVDFIMGQGDRKASYALMAAEKRDNPHLYPLINERVRAKQGEQAGG